MAQTAFTVRMEHDTKQEFESLCQQFGMSVTTAINVFAKAVIKNQGIPFAIEANTKEQIIANGKKAFEQMRASAAKNGLSDMPLEEINREIMLTREGL